MKNDAWFIIGLIVFIFLIWVATGGPRHPISFNGPTINPPQQLGGGTYLSFPKAPFGVGNGSEVHLWGSSSGGYSTTTDGVGATIPGQSTPVPDLEGVSFGTPSPYRSLVSLSHYVSGSHSQNPDNEYLSISINDTTGVPVDITGWRLESSATGNGATIPQGTALPLSGVINPAQDIVLMPGDSAYLISGQSPIGASFEENKCIGYYGQFQTFSPSLPLNCPLPSTELQQNYGANYYIRDASCIDYVDALPRCQSQLSPPVSLSGACQSFLVKYINYNGCVDAHKNDSDFEEGIWYVYLGSTSSLWRSQHEVIKLLDKNGDTVDAFSY